MRASTERSHPWRLRVLSRIRVDPTSSPWIVAYSNTPPLSEALGRTRLF